jgi:cell division protein FtsB
MIAPDTSPGRGPKHGEAPAPLSRPAGRAGRWIRYVLVAMTVVLLVDAVFGDKGLLALLQAQKQFAAVERALQQSRDDNAKLRQMARRLREDPSAIEAVAREQLGLIKPGEKLFIVRNAAPTR